MVAVSLVVLALRSKLIRDAFAQMLSFWRGMTALGRMAAVLLFSVCMIYGSTKTNSPPLRIVRPLPVLRTIAPTTVSKDEVARGFRQVCVATNENASFAMPSNGTVVRNWHKRGTFGEWMRLELGDFAFPLGTNDDVCTSFSVFSDGRIRPTPRDTAREICAVGVPMLAVQGTSRFWTAGYADGSMLLTWEQFFLNGDTNVPVSAQIRLWPNGDFSTSSNEVETAYARICPYDWDGDGVPNGVDANPCAYDGDFNGPANLLPDGANSNAYCTVSLVATGPDTLVTFTGDRPSNYPDPCFIARHGVTNEVVILIGKAYEVTFSGAMEVVVVSDPATEIVSLGGSVVQVRRPVSVSNSGGNPFTMLVSPNGLGGVFSWLPTGCGCAISGSGDTFSFTCSSTCTCCGTSAEGSYVYEGYSLPVTSCLCGCYYDGTGPTWTETQGPMAASVSASFSKSAVIFENAYENQPGQWTPKNSTRTRLNIVANGGPNGATLSVTQANISKLASISGPDLPLAAVTVPAETQVSYSIVYEGMQHSQDANDIVVVAALSENITEIVSIATGRVSSVSVELSPIYEAPENPCVHRHVYGVGEKIECRHVPLSISGTWRIDGIEGFNSLDAGNGCDNVLTLSFIGAEVPDLRFGVPDVEYTFQLQMLVPTGIVCTFARWDGCCSARGLAGGFGMKQHLYVLPMSVSFQGIDMQETPCSEVIPPSGYYASTNYTGVLSHTIAAEAGWWHHIKPGNYWTEDNPYAAVRYPPFAEGVMTWKIPISWFQRFDGELSWPQTFGSISQCRVVASEAYRQTFTMSDEGTISIAKFGYVVERSTNDVVRLDGQVVHEGD